jgi:hypothetical protein
MLLVPQPAAELARHTGCPDDGAHAVAVDRPTLPGTVEVNEVQVFGPLFDPATRHRGGVGAEDGFLRIVALAQAHALAAAQVDSRE